MNEPNASEQLVTSLCNRSFLSFWSYPMPRGKEQGKELCDVLVVCDPDIVIFSIKDIGPKKTDDPAIGWERWRKKAIDAPCKQIYGAQRWISSATNVVTKDGEKAFPFPESSRRRVHRVAVALGSREGAAHLRRLRQRLRPRLRHPNKLLSAGTGTPYVSKHHSLLSLREDGSWRGQ